MSATNRDRVLRTAGTASRRCRAAAAALLLSALVGCAATLPNEVREQLDERTGTTVTTLAAPLQLIVAEARGAGSDPFAFVAPFETNRMGARALFLWVAIPNESRADVTIGIATDEGRVLPLGSAFGEAQAGGLADFPYRAPAPWSSVRAYALAESAIAQLAAATRVHVDVSYAGSGSARYSGDVTPADLFARFRERLGL